jgi:hypothetical protein
VESDLAVKESRDRVKAAVENRAFRHPFGRTMTNPYSPSLASERLHSVDAPAGFYWR